MNIELIKPPLFEYTKLFNLLLPVLALFVVIALVNAFRNTHSVPGQLRAIIPIVAIVVTAANFDAAVKAGQEAVADLVENKLGARPDAVAMRFIEKIGGAQDQQETGKWWALFTKVGTALVQGLVEAFVVINSVMAFCFMVLAYLAQELALEVGIALAPLFLSFLLLSSTRSIGVQFLLHMLALLLMPVGWGVASLISDRIIDYATNIQMLDVNQPLGAMTFAMRGTWGGLLLAIWIDLSTSVVPFAMMKMVTTGVSLGTGALVNARPRSLIQ